MNRAHDQQCLLSRKLQDTSGQFVRLKFPSPLKFSHWWIDFDVRGSIFHSVRIRQCTRLTDLNSDYESMHCTFAVASTSLLMKSVQQIYHLRLPNNAYTCDRSD
ncbi:UNVERIFIED_CONTAM: hypothetical protein NCL1_60891 [Trichonephila clavipes]